MIFLPTFTPISIYHCFAAYFLKHFPQKDAVFILLCKYYGVSKIIKLEKNA